MVLSCSNNWAIQDLISKIMYTFVEEYGYKSPAYYTLLIYNW